MKKLMGIILILITGIITGEIEAHVKETQWGYIWNLEPEPDFPNIKPMLQLVKCPNGDLTLPPWHVRVLWHKGTLNPFGAFLQERGH